MSYATRLIDESTDPDEALTVQQIITATLDAMADAPFKPRLLDPTIDTGSEGGAEVGEIFRSTVNGKVYQRLAGNVTELLNNEPISS